MGIELVPERPPSSRLPQRQVWNGQNESDIHFYPSRHGQLTVATVADKTKEGPNEDAAAVANLSDGTLLLMVADGVGGMASAREAAGLCLNAIVDAAERAVTEDRRVRSGILDGIEAANAAVLELGQGAATTLVIAEISNGNVRTYHVGDSAIVLIGQRGAIKLQTTPHSPVGFAVEAGMLDEHEAIHHEDLNLISNVIGSVDMRIEIGPETPIATFDTLLLASDGLFDNLLMDEIIDMVRKGPVDRNICMLTRAALARMEGNAAGQPAKPDDLTTLLYRRPAPRRRKKPTPAPATKNETAATT